MYMPIKYLKDMFIRKNFPYCLEINNKTNEVYYINRDYEYIGFNTKCFSDIRDDSVDFERTYIYKDDSKPWRNMKNYNNAANKIEELCRGKTVKTPIFIFSED